MTNFINEIKIFVVGKSLEYGKWISDNIVNTIEEADLIVFTGGEDVTPMMYGEQQHITTEVNKNRDLREAVAYIKAISLSKPVLAICRGSQFVTIMNDGKLIQNIHGHATSRGHRITDGKSAYIVTSTHHQMMYPFDMNPEDYQLIAWSKEKLSDTYETGFGQYSQGQVKVEPEVIYYPKTNTLAVQYHPEYMRSGDEAVEYTKELICKHLFNGKVEMPKVGELVMDDSSISQRIIGRPEWIYANVMAEMDNMGVIINDADPRPIINWNLEVDLD